MEKLAIVIPVYNEEKIIGEVIDRWILALNALQIDYVICLFNDGSKDHSGEVLTKKADEYPGRISVISKDNRGHGPTILQGYLDSAKKGYDWVFQVDSDNEMGPERFSVLWNKRSEYDFLVGKRQGRKQQLSRKIVSAVSRMSVRLLFGKSIWDVNTPYRLMRVSSFQEIWENIPQNTFAPNVLISGMAAKRKLRCYETEVPQTDRQTGVVSIKKWKLFKASVKSFIQTAEFAFSQPDMRNWFIIAALISFIAKIAMSGQGHNYDFESYRIVSDIVSHGGNVYAKTARYNYAPVWSLILGVGNLFHEYFRLYIITILSLADFGIGWLLWKMRYHIAALVFILSPVGIYISGFHNQFDNLAVFFAFAAIYLLTDSREDNERKNTWFSALLLTLSLLVKHVFIIFTVWILFRNISWKKKLITAVLPVCIFCVSFIPWVLPSFIEKSGEIRNDICTLSKNIRQDLAAGKKLNSSIRTNLSVLIPSVKDKYKGTPLYGFGIFVGL